MFVFRVYTHIEINFTCLSSPSGPLTNSLSLTPVQSTAWSEQQQQEHREEISRKPLERSNVRLIWLRFV